MFNYWSDFDRFFSAFDELSRRGATQRNWPAIAVADEGNSLAVTAAVPGLAKDDLSVELNQDTLSISGARNVDAPEGYSVHRKERSSLRFSRSVRLPVKVDPEKVAAEFKNGVLSITLEKAPEAKRRQIAVR